MNRRGFLKSILASGVVALSACTMEGNMDPSDRNKIMVCRDLRDGETFEFNTNTVRNMRVGIAGAPTTATFTDSTGRERTISSYQNSFFKCEPKRSHLTFKE